MVTIEIRNRGIVVSDGITKPPFFIKPPIFSLYTFKHLRKRSKILGFVGIRGSGKSVGAARTIVLDGLLKGRPVWSNMLIEVQLLTDDGRVALRTRDLDELAMGNLDTKYRNGIVYLDEVNINYAESRRSMSKANLSFSRILQQIRHRQLDVIWSAQSEMHCDERLRWQTDIFVQCSDVSIKNPKVGIGEYSRWILYDLSGIIKGEPPIGSQDAVFKRLTMWNRPWWHVYDTEQMQGVGNKEPEVAYHDSAWMRKAKVILQEVQSQKITSLPAQDLWSLYEIDDFSERIQLGMALKSLGILKKRVLNQGYVYIFNEGGNHAG